MVVVSSNLVYSHLEEPKVEKMFRLLENDLEVQSCLRMTNVMAVKRLMYNNHGPVHSRIASGSALEFFDLLTRKVTPTTVENDVCSIEDALKISEGQVSSR